MKFKDLRREYSSKILSRKGLQKNPFEQFSIWFQDAVELNVLEPNTMTLATATPDGKPSSRTVLLKEFDESGLVFYTNYLSRKSRELDTNPYASVTFLWMEIPRQVIIEGSVTKLSQENSDTYFSTRPRDSQLGAWASIQDEVIPNREHLDNQFQEMEEKFKGKDVPRPDFWGGYRIHPTRFEFWHGRTHRLHDRFAYTLHNDGRWMIERISP